MYDNYVQNCVSPLKANYAPNFKVSYLITTLFGDTDLVWFESFLNVFDRN